MPPSDQPKTRASLACLPCRNRHIKCDGGRPFCRRCSSGGKVCHYAQSRRGGLDRAALAALRRRNEAAAAVGQGTVSPAEEALSSDQSPDWGVTTGPSVSELANDLQYDQSEDAFDFASMWTSEPDTISLTPPSSTLHIQDDPLITVFYQTFHGFHPCALPKRHLIRLSEQLDKRGGFPCLILMMRYIGSLYSQSSQAETLKQELVSCLSSAPRNDPLMVQCYLFYSVTVFWNGDRPLAQKYMDDAVQIAYELGMYRQGFAVENGLGDAVLQESWRRTWWQLYVIDGYYKGTVRTTPFRTGSIDATVDLPCEESEYESGLIPEPKTLEDYDCREFCPDNSVFSSFAQLIGSVRCAAKAVTVMTEELSRHSSPEIIESVDSALEGWLLLLPQERKVVMSKSGDIDELMFQAQALVHTAIIGLHRQFSDLKFTPVERLSRCATDTPDHHIPTELVNVHTTRMLRSIRAQVHLLALPARPFSHSPFLTCEITVGTLALLSACCYVLRGKELAVARDQIRMAIGCLKDIATVWPETLKSIQEVQMVARDVLGLGSKGTSTTNLSTPGSVRQESEKKSPPQNGDDAPTIDPLWVQMIGLGQDSFCSWLQD
ncbi:hypothetical protein B0I35DRAFT_67249 [Stachybotrys elegans]|uniref:Zn(2)-C6 fungal-type domain-containing protein n=1 Tax=Stachybotrys elegans TaxID=80388 RepID=A0A8K0SGK8_9HYPO|nr:hypothetical protein B0I35DRAFT_67249 [Stachybotrys elegans]